MYFDQFPCFVRLQTVIIKINEVISTEQGPIGKNYYRFHKIWRKD